MLRRVLALTQIEQGVGGPEKRPTKHTVDWTYESCKAAALALCLKRRQGSTFIMISIEASSMNKNYTTLASHAHGSEHGALGLLAIR